MARVKTNNYPNQNQDSTTTIGRKFRVEYTTSYPEDFAQVRVFINGKSSGWVQGTIEVIRDYYKGLIAWIEMAQNN